jgi:hypothetical protein
MFYSVLGLPFSPCERCCSKSKHHDIGSQCDQSHLNPNDHMQQRATSRMMRDGNGRGSGASTTRPAGASSQAPSTHSLLTFPHSGFNSFSISQGFRQLWFLFLCSLAHSHSCQHEELPFGIVLCLISSASVLNTSEIHSQHWQE